MNGVAILNPRAGLAAARARAALERSAHWRGMQVRLTTGPGDARQFASEADWALLLEGLKTPRR